MTIYTTNTVFTTSLSSVYFESHPHKAMRRNKTTPIKTYQIKKNEKPVIKKGTNQGKFPIIFSF